MIKKIAAINNRLYNKDVKLFFLCVVNVVNLSNEGEDTICYNIN